MQNFLVLVLVMFRVITVYPNLRPYKGAMDIFIYVSMLLILLWLLFLLLYVHTYKAIHIISRSPSWRRQICLKLEMCM